MSCLAGIAFEYFLPKMKLAKAPRSSESPYLKETIVGPDVCHITEVSLLPFFSILVLLGCHIYKEKKLPNTTLGQKLDSS